MLANLQQVFNAGARFYESLVSVAPANMQMAFKIDNEIID